MRGDHLRKPRFDLAAREQEEASNRLLKGQRTYGYLDGVREATKLAIFNAAISFFSTREPGPYRDELVEIIDQAVDLAEARRRAHARHTMETLFERLDREATERNNDMT